MLPKRDSEDLNLKVLLWDFQHDSSYACLRLLGLGAQLRFRQCGEHVSKQALPRAGALEAFSCSAAASKFIFVVRSGITATGNPTATGNLAKASNCRGLQACKRLRVLGLLLVHPGAPDQATDVWLWKSDKHAETMFTRPLQEFAELHEHNALAGRSLQAAFPPCCFWCPSRVNIAGGQGVSEASSGYWSDEAEFPSLDASCPYKRMGCCVIFATVS